MSNLQTVYKIASVSRDVVKCYIGSTTNIIKRTRVHKYNATNETAPLYNKPLYKYIRENGGWDNFRVEKLEILSNATLLHQIELFYIKLNSANCFNKNIPLRTIQQYQKDNILLLKQYQKDYKIKNKERLNAYQVAYYHRKIKPQLNL